MCGDFNIVKVASDKDGIFPFRWIAGQWEVWFRMCNKLGLFDPNINCRPSQSVWNTWHS